MLDCLETVYRPASVIVYGAHPDGSRGSDGDFDALLIAPRGGIPFQMRPVL